MKKKQARIEIRSSNQDGEKEAWPCDLELTLSLLADFDRCSRSRCPPMKLQTTEGDEVDDYDELGFDVYFAEGPDSRQSETNCVLQADALNPSGYRIILTVPRYWFSSIVHPRHPFVQYAADKGPVSHAQLVRIVETLFNRPDKELLPWAQTQTYLNQLDNSGSSRPATTATQFTYVAQNKAGEQVEGTVDAKNQGDAVRAVQRLGYMPISIVPKT